MKLLRIALIISTIIFTSLSNAAEPNLETPTGFTTLEEFVNALEDMPNEQFIKKGDLTSIENIRRWRRTLLRLDSENFAKWNKKLSLLPTAGLKNNPTLWLLDEPKKLVGVGYVPQKIPKPIVSIVDFYHSVRFETLEVLQARARLSSAQDLNRWLVIIQKTNPQLFTKTILKANIVRQVGFSNHKKIHEYPDPEIPRNEAGFVVKKTEFLPLGKIDTLQDLINAYKYSTYEEFHKLLGECSFGQVRSMLIELEKTDPELLAEIKLKYKTRTAVGYDLNGGDPDVITQSNSNKKKSEAKLGFKPDESNPSVSKSDSKSSVRKIGFRPEADPCSISAILAVLTGSK